MADPERPNIILICADQWRGDALGIGGSPHIQTPNIDFLAARGTRFSHAYSACPSCIPARAILWTGMSQWHTGVLGMGRGQGPIPNDFPHTLAGELTAAGYQTHLTGKGHFRPQRALMGFETTELDESGRVESRGFKDDYREWFETHLPSDVSPDDHGIDWNAWQSREWHLEEHTHPSAWTMTRALTYLANRQEKEKPFFLNISFARPHSPFVPPRPYWEMYSDKALPKPNVGDWTSIYDRSVLAPSPNAWRAILTDEQIHRARAGYYGEISFIDAQIGRLMNWMNRFAQDAVGNTCFVFMSDHGDMLGDHHLYRKTYAYEGSARVPFIIAAPGTRHSIRHVADEVVELRDIMPTLLDVAGVACPKTVEGKSVLPLCQSPGSNWRTYIHGEHCDAYGPEQEMQFVTDGKQKFIWLPRIDREQFFDLTTDPGECHDLIKDGKSQDAIKVWRDRLTTELAARNCGWVKDGRPFCPDDRPLISPYKETRWTGPA